MWIQSVYNAISEVNHNHPGLVSKVAQLNPTGEVWSDKDWEDYNKVAGAIVEPFEYAGFSKQDWMDDLKTRIDQIT